MELNELVTAKSLAFRLTNDPSNQKPYSLEAFFPPKRILGRDIRNIRAHRGVGVVLAPSNEDATPVIRPRAELNVEQFEMPLFREQRKIDEHDYYNMMRVQSANDPFAEEIVKHIFDDANDLITSARISAELMRAQLLSANGGNMGITVGTKDNTVYNINYDKNGTWKSEHYVTLTGTDTWDNLNSSTPLDDLQRGIDYLISTGVVPRYILLNGTTMNYLVYNAQIKNSLLTVTGQTVDFMTAAKAKAVIEQTLGITILTYDKTFRGYDGNNTKFYPDNYVTIIGDGILGNTYFGTTAEERTLMSNPIAQVSIMDPGIAVAMVTKPGPPVETLTTVSQIVLPSFEGMDSIFVIKVK